MKKKSARRKSSYSPLTKHGKYFCKEFVKFISVLSVVTVVVLGSYNYINNVPQVLGAQTSIYQQQCSFWNVLCHIKSFFTMNPSQNQHINASDFLSPTITQTQSFSDSIDPTALPLGDGKYTTSPKIGYIYTCQTTFTGGGAQENGSWIHASTWDATAKISVEGSVSWPNATFTISTSGDKRVFSGNGLPVGYTTGVFPISSTDPAYQIDRNPNSIKTQNYSFSLPLNPTMGKSATCIMGMVGIALDGIPIFDGLDAGGRDAVAHEVQDSCDAHPQESGQYHYHGPSNCLKETSEKNTLVGYALDGYGIYSMYDSNGKEYSDSDLDACHGITSEVMWNGKMQNMYHYVLTREYPYSVGCFKGSIVTSDMLNGSSRNSLGTGGQMQGRMQQGQKQLMGGQGAMRPTGMMRYPPQGGSQQGQQGKFPPPPPPNGM